MIVVIQLATIDKTVPQVRSCIVRELISPAGNEHLPIVLTTADIRTPKVEQILANDAVQINWWIAPSMDQFRLTGKVTLVPEPGNGVFHSGGNLGFERLSAGGFDWEGKRVQAFDSLSGRMRACWCRPTPGSPMKGGYEEAEKWPETIPTTTGATNEKEKKLVDEALGNFVLVLIEPTFVDWVQLGTTPDRRTFFYRGDDGSWTEDIVVP
jgi:pyridoxamine 5'-phosphate oxidase